MGAVHPDRVLVIGMNRLTLPVSGWRLIAGTVLMLTCGSASPASQRACCSRAARAVWSKSLSARQATSTPRSVMAVGELLTDPDRALIEQGFATPVIDAFASTEGLVGHSQPGGSVLSFASDMCLAEPVDDDNQPAPPGEPSTKVLVTNLHNFTQPLVRYELTDGFTSQTSAPGGWLRASVEGRADDAFHYASVAVHPHVIRSALVSQAAVREYQVRQTERGAMRSRPSSCSAASSASLDG